MANEDKSNELSSNDSPKETPIDVHAMRMNAMRDSSSVEEPQEEVDEDYIPDPEEQSGDSQEQNDESGSSKKSSKRSETNRSSKNQPDDGESGKKSSLNPMDSLKSAATNKMKESIPGANSKAAQTAQKLQETGVKAAEFANRLKDTAIAAKGFIVALFNPYSLIAIAILLVVTFLLLSLTTSLQVFGRNENIRDCADDGSVNVSVNPDGDKEARANNMGSWLMGQKFSFLGGKPMSKRQAAAVVGNFDAEGGVQFAIAERKDGNGDGSKDKMSNSEAEAWTKGGARGLGLAQWTWNPGRAGNLIEKAKSLGKNWYDPESQLGLLKDELDGSYGPKLNSAGFNDPAKSAKELAIIFHNVFEGSADSGEMIQKRGDTAAMWEKKLKDGGTSYNPDSGDACGTATLGGDGTPVPGKPGWVYPFKPNSCGPNKSAGACVLNTYGGHPFSAKDITTSNTVGNPVYAVREGTVTMVEERTDFMSWCGGIAVGGPFYENKQAEVRIVSNYEGTELETIYAHLKLGSFAVKKGDKVKAGTVIGLGGNSGCTTGAHLHIQFDGPKGKGMDPRSIFGNQF